MKKELEVVVWAEVLRSDDFYYQQYMKKTTVKKPDVMLVRIPEFGSIMDITRRIDEDRLSRIKTSLGYSDTNFAANIQYFGGMWLYPELFGFQGHTAHQSYWSRKVQKSRNSHDVYVVYGVGDTIRRKLCNGHGISPLLAKSILYKVAGIRHTSVTPSDMSDFFDGVLPPNLPEQKTMLARMAGGFTKDDYRRILLGQLFNSQALKFPMIAKFKHRDKDSIFWGDRTMLLSDIDFIPALEYSVDHWNNEVWKDTLDLIGYHHNSPTLSTKEYLDQFAAAMTVMNQ